MKATFYVPGDKKPMFQLGQKVGWASQANGVEKIKEGVVVQVVPPGVMPDREAFLDLYKGSGVGMWRKGYSYVVAVGNKHYWPRTNHLGSRESWG